MERREALRTSRSVESDSDARSPSARQTPEESSAAEPPASPRTDAEPAAARAPESDPRLLECWGRIQTELLELVQPEQFETWFRRAEVRSVADDVVCLCVQNSFTRDWLARNYITQLERAVKKVLGPDHRLEFAVDPELTVPAFERAADAATSNTNGADAVHGSAAPALQGSTTAQASRRLGLMQASDVQLNAQYRFDSFVVGPCNRFAHAASVGVSENPGSTYNPYFLHGSVGLGKTHLLQSLCYALLEREPNTRILYLSCETFVNHFISAIENGDLTKFRNKYRNVDVLVVDDIHLLANKERTQEEFFHTFNTLYNGGKQIVLSSDSSPKEIPSLQDRLVSRFKWGLVTEIEEPCYETRMAIVKRKSKDRGHELPDDVAVLIAENIDSNIRELEGAVTRVLGFASLNGQKVTTELTRTVLREVFVTSRGQPTMESVLRCVTDHFNVKLSELQSRRRTKAIAHPRQIGMYLLRQVTPHSLEEIGGFFGGRDHSTVLYAVDKVHKEMLSNPQFAELIAGFLGKLQRGRS